MSTSLRSSLLTLGHDRPAASATRAEAKRDVGQRIAALARALDQLACGGAIDDEAEIAPLGDALVGAKREHHARVEIGVGRLVDDAVERAEGDVADRLPAGAQPGDGARRAQRPAVDRANDGKRAHERREDLGAR